MMDGWLRGSWEWEWEWEWEEEEEEEEGEGQNPWGSECWLGLSTT